MTYEEFLKENLESLKEHFWGIEAKGYKNGVTVSTNKKVLSARKKSFHRD
ncbi:MAG: hypothetical protein IPL26_17995 [Leptospiraceae bacterium]|nr:hypothetical protein [Leptospiraceae bacterium]